MDPRYSGSKQSKGGAKNTSKGSTEDTDSTDARHPAPILRYYAGY
jgi:hypothetical protein